MDFTASQTDSAISVDLEAIGAAARDAARQLAVMPAALKNRALLAIADELEAQAAGIIAQNVIDLDKGRAKGLSDSLLDRLMLDHKRVTALAADTRRVAELPDPVGGEFDSRLLPNGLHLSKRRIPIGVLGVVYEARPNVTIDVAALCLKTGNAAILRGGTETLHSNLALVQVIQSALERIDFPDAAVQYIANPDRALVTGLLRLDKYVDMIIPRGGAALHRLCRDQATIPVITGGIGVCHLFVDASADLARSLDVIENAKVQRPSVCNAIDTVLIHRAVASEFLPMLAERLARSRVELRAAGPALAILAQNGQGAAVVEAGLDDFDTEWMALILGVKVVDGVEAAIQHIFEHGSEHSVAS